jgi:hypothetical protein
MESNQVAWAIFLAISVVLVLWLFGKVWFWRIAYVASLIGVIFMIAKSQFLLALVFFGLFVVCYIIANLVRGMIGEQ